MSDIDMLREEIKSLRKFCLSPDTDVFSTLYILRNTTHTIRYRTQIIQTKNYNDPEVKMYTDQILSSLTIVEGHIFTVNRTMHPADLVAIIEDLLSQMESAYTGLRDLFDFGH
jgi:hypothetical protein